MRDPLVSIIMPMFNEEKHINVCIESIIDQDFVSWELIIVDDFSDDQSLAAAQKFADQDQRISVLKNQNKGITNALRLGFQKVSGKYLTRMDADDIMPPGKLNTLFERLCELGPGHVVCGKVKYFSDGFLADGFKKYEAWINEQKFYENIYQECTLPSACWMMSVNDLKDIGAFDEDIYPEDYDLLFRIYKNQYKIIGIDQTLHLWRDHPERASRNDANYFDQNFFDLKLKYFLLLDHNKDKNLYLWGAGKKGKDLAKKMIALEIDFIWITNNEKKIGKEIYGKVLLSTNSLANHHSKQVISAISSLNFQENKFEHSENLIKNNCEYFHFC